MCERETERQIRQRDRQARIEKEMVNLVTVFCFLKGNRLFVLER